MGIVHSYVSTEHIINKLYSSTGMQEGVNLHDCIEWVYEVMQLVGSPQQYIPKVIGYKENSDLDYTNWVFPLPDDFHSLQAMIINGAQARPSDNSMHYLLSGNCCGYNNVPTEFLDTFTDNFGNEFSPQLGNISSVGIDITFHISNSVVTTNIKQGKVCMSYLAFPVDCKGYPMIPENAKYQKMVELYLRAKIDYREWRSDSDSKGKRALYEDSEREYCFYAASATNSLKMPNEQQMNNLKNQMTNIIPRIQEWEQYWSTLSTNRGIRG